MKKYDEEGLSLAKESSDSSKKTVFLIGDSIRMGYEKYVRERLETVGNVKSPKENCRNTQFTYINLSWWKDIFEDTSRVDLVYWNNGHWDIAHWCGDELPLNSVEVYCEMLTRIYFRLKSIFPNAKIVFATTTPCNPNGSVGVNPRSNDEIKEYNRAAKETLEELGVVIHDLFDVLANMDERIYSDYCHLTEEGFSYLGKSVAEFIKGQL